MYLDEQQPAAGYAWNYLLIHPLFKIQCATATCAVGKYLCVLEVLSSLSMSCSFAEKL